MQSCCTRYYSLGTSPYTPDPHPGQHLLLCLLPCGESRQKDPALVVDDADRSKKNQGNAYIRGMNSRRGFKDIRLKTINSKKDIPIFSTMHVYPNQYRCIKRGCPSLCMIRNNFSHIVCTTTFLPMQIDLN